LQIRSTLLGLLLACQGALAGEGQDWQWPEGFPPPPVPADNPLSAAKVRLGELLFFDTRLSQNGTQSCASCHRPEREFTDGRRRAVGATGSVHPRNTPTLWNVAYNVSFTWLDAGLDALEKQIRIPLTGTAPLEMGFSEALLPTLAADAALMRRHAEAFGAEPLSLDTVIRALATYVRTLVRADRPFDRFFLYDDRSRFPDEARDGLALFFAPRLGCSECHAGPHLSGPTHAPGQDVAPVFHRTAVGGAAFPVRAPSLRFVSLTAPYMHDGSLDTLDDVIAFYSAGGNAHSERLRPFVLTAAERRALLAFLETL